MERRSVEAVIWYLPMKLKLMGSSRKLRATPPKTGRILDFPAKKTGPTFENFSVHTEVFHVLRYFWWFLQENSEAKKMKNEKNVGKILPYAAKWQDAVYGSLLSKIFRTLGLLGWYHTVKFCGEILTVFIRRPYIYFLKISVYTRYLSYSSTLLNFQDSYKLRLECWVVLGLEFWVLFD